MDIKLNGEKYEIIIEKKNNKNMYMRVKEDLRIYIYAPLLTPKSLIKKFILSNESYLLDRIEDLKRKNDKKNYFYLLGKQYDIVYLNTCKHPFINEDKIFTKKHEDLEKYKRKTANVIFVERLKHCFNLFEEDIYFPDLKIRKMKAKWGHCNKGTCTITLTLNLVDYSIDEIDYVIIHELCHLVHFNHSKAFWNLVEKYKPNYRNNKKVLREE